MHVLKKPSDLKKSLEALIDPSWHDMLFPYLLGPRGVLLFEQLRGAKRIARIFPSTVNIFRAFQLTKLDDVQVVILGSEPVAKQDMSTGLSFGVRERLCPNEMFAPEILSIEASVKDNVFLFSGSRNTTHYLRDFDFTFEKWAAQGVLMLNMSLTVQAYSPESHTNIWKPFINYVLLELQKRRIVYMLWGDKFKKVKEIISEARNEIYEADHPLDLNSSFLTNNHFSDANDFFLQNGMKEIKWL